MLALDRACSNSLKLADQFFVILDRLKFAHVATFRAPACTQKGASRLKLSSNKCRSWRAVIYEPHLITRAEHTTAVVNRTIAVPVRMLANLRVLVRCLSLSWVPSAYRFQAHKAASVDRPHRLYRMAEKGTLINSRYPLAV